MIFEITGDLLDTASGIICHQTNYHGAMGGGVARAIAEKILSEDQYAAYVAYCKERGRTALGTVQFLGEAPGLIVANVFSQDELKPQIEGNFDITDYGAMTIGLEHVRDMAERFDLSVHIPSGMGCGIAGGDWDRVRGIIDDVFADTSIEVYIVKREAAK